MLEENTQLNPHLQYKIKKSSKVKIGKLPSISQKHPQNNCSYTNSSLPPKPTNLTNFIGYRRQQQAQTHSEHLYGNFQVSHSIINSNDEENFKKVKARNNSNTKISSQILTQSSFSHQINKHAELGRAKLETVEDLDQQKYTLRNLLPTFIKTKHSLTNSRFMNLTHFKSSKNNHNAFKLINTNNNIYNQNNTEFNDNFNNKPIQEGLHIMSKDNKKVNKEFEKLGTEESEENLLEKTIPFERRLKMNRFDNLKSIESKNSLVGTKSERNKDSDVSSSFTKNAVKLDNLSLRGSSTKLSKWGSIVGLRDSIRNLTSCVSIRVPRNNSTDINSTIEQKPFDRRMREWSQDSLEFRKKTENTKMMIVETTARSQPKIFSDETSSNQNIKLNKSNFNQIYKNQQSLLLLPSSLGGSSLALTAHCSSTPISTIVEPKIKIKKKPKVKLNNQSTSSVDESTSNSIYPAVSPSTKIHFQDEESNRDVLDMIEKVQSNGFDDQRYKQPCNISAGSSATEFLSKFPTLSNNTNKILQANYSSVTSLNSPTALNTSTLPHNNRRKSSLNTPDAPDLTNEKPPLSESANSQRQKTMSQRKQNANTEDRLVQLLAETRQQNLPMVSLPDNDSYWSEGWKCHSNQLELDRNDLSIVSSAASSPASSSSASPFSSASSSPSSFSQANTGVNNSSSSQVQIEVRTDLSIDYLETFNEKQHVVFYGQDLQSAPFILSYRIETNLESSSDNKSSENVCAVLRTKETNFCMRIPLVNLSVCNNQIAEHIENMCVTPVMVCKTLCPELKPKFFYPLTDLNGFKLIRNFDNHSLNKNLKFGVIYMKKGQTTEEELFSNQEHSASFDNFLNLLGNRVQLRGHTGFRGGLDTVNGQTGDYSVYQIHNNNQIMFHVSTLLPFSKTDSQQLERKRHIGNDIVAIVFQEDNTPFAPDMIASNFLHTFIVVQRFTDNNNKEKYRVSVVARKDVPNFGPPINTESVFENDEVFRDWLLNKLVNAEIACYKAEKFKKLNERTRACLFDALYSDLHEKNCNFLQSLFGMSSDFGDSSSESAHSQLGNKVLEHINNGSNSSNLLHSSIGGSSTNLSNSSTAFKFSLLNTVRKAFKKSDSNVKQAVPVGHRPVQQIQSAPLQQSKQISNQPTRSASSFQGVVTVATTPGSDSDMSSNSSVLTGRNRSSTFDGTSFKSSLLAKNYLEPHQAKELFSSTATPKKGSIKDDRFGKHTEYNLYGKIGSIDSLNNIENYSTNGFRSNVGSVPPSILLPNHTISANNRNQQQNYHHSKPKTLNLNNMSLSDLTNGVTYKKVPNYVNYTDNNKNNQRSGSSSPEGNGYGLSQRQRHIEPGASKLTKNNLMKSASSIRNDDSDTGMGSLTPNSSGLSSASTTDFYSNSNTSPTTNSNVNIQNQHSLIIK